jgi:hypothetical protein
MYYAHWSSKAKVPVGRNNQAGYDYDVHLDSSKEGVLQNLYKQ